MDKIRICFLFVLLFGCRSGNNYSKGNYNLEFDYNTDIRINFNSRKVRIISDPHFTYPDSIRISNADQLDIIKAFNDYDIQSVDRSEVYYNPKVIMMPPEEIIFRIYHSGHQQAEIRIANNLTRNQYFPFGVTYRLTSFRDVVQQVLDRNDDLKRLTRMNMEYNRQLWKKAQTRK